MSDGEELPDGWAATTLSDVIESTFYGPRFGADAYVDDGIPTVRTTDMNDRGEIRFRDPPRVKVSVEELSRFGLRDGDVLVTRSGSIGRCAVYDSNLGAAIPSAYLIRVRLRDGAALPRYVLARLLSPAGQEHLGAVATAVTQSNVNAGAIASLSVPLPPLAEQRRIVAKLEELLARSRRAKEALDAIPSLLETLRRSILAAAFRGDLTADWREEHPDVEPAEKLLARIRVERRKKWEEAELVRLKAKGRAPGDDRWKEKYREPEPVDAEGLPELPEGWTWERADNIVEPGTVVTYGIVQPGEPIPDGVPYVRGQDIEDGRILVDQLLRTTRAIAEKHDRSELHEDDVLLCIIRYLKVAIVPPGIDGANLTQGTVRLRPSSAIAPKFLAGWLASPAAQDWMKSRYFGLAMPRINVEDARAVPVPIAPKAEQGAIVDALDRLLTIHDRLARAHRELTERATGLDRSVLSKAFRGELVPQDPNDEPAEVLLARLKAVTDFVEKASAKNAGGEPTDHVRSRT